MAKRYVKPGIQFQSLAVGADMSAGCHIPSLFAEFDCPVLIPEWGETVFTESNCDWSNGDFPVCYHVPTVSSNVFGS